MLGDLGAAKGKFVAERYDRLGSGVYDDFHKIHGSTWYVEYPPELRKQIKDQMKRLDDLHEQMLAAVAKKHGVPQVLVGRAHYATEVDFVCEIVGRTMYTPKVELRDAGGKVIGTTDGTPYPVPSIAIRGLSSRLYVIVPGAGSSLDEMKVDGVMP